LQKKAAIPKSDRRQHTGDNVRMDAIREQLAAEILAAIRSDCDLYLYDHYITGPNRRQRARELLIEKRDACSDADEGAFLTTIIRRLETLDD
jgi:hypothetical protein